MAKSPLKTTWFRIVKYGSNLHWTCLNLLCILTWVLMISKMEQLMEWMTKNYLINSHNKKMPLHSANASTISTQAKKLPIATHDRR